MSSVNITRQEAQQRSQVITAHSSQWRPAQRTD